MLAVCGVCKEITPCTHLQYWQGIKINQEFKKPQAAKPKRAPQPKAKPQTQPSEQPVKEAEAPKATSELLG